jgi:hypothetical protein
LYRIIDKLKFYPFFLVSSFFFILQRNFNLFILFFLLSGVLILVIAYTAMGSILFVTLEGEIEENDTIETAVAASKPFPRNDGTLSSDMRTR